jgi:hypothetical protein
VSEPNDKFDVVSPIGEPKAQPESPATQITDFRGKTIGMVWNAEFRADQVFAALTELLKQRFPNIKVIPCTEMPTAQQRMDVTKNMEDLRQAYLQKGCNAVITATGG